MGLRFRKSVTLCKGVRLNFGKTGTSISVGGHGYRKTFHSSGKVTTSVGIPGTGIYWTDTKNPRSNRSRNANGREAHNTNRRNATYSNIGPNEIRDYSLDRVIPAEDVNYDPVWLTETFGEDKNIEEYEAVNNTFNYEDVDEDLYGGVNSVEWEQNTKKEKSYIKDDSLEYLNEEYIHNIYVKCDESIEWGELLAGTSAEDLMMEESFWSECKKYCAEIMRGDIDTYLEVIEVFRPVDDILLYAGEFEFGTDASNYIETEFRVNPNDVLEDGINNPLFEEFVYSVATRKVQAGYSQGESQTFLDPAHV